MIAAVLLGPAAAIGIRSRLPGLITVASDAIVIALYLAVLFGVAATGVAFVASMGVARFVATADARRARVVCRVAGTAVGMACLVYLTLWWRTTNTELAWAAPGWTVTVLVVAVLISLLLGHAVSITTFAVIAARTPMSRSDAGADSTRRLVFGAGVLAFLGAASLLLIAPSSGDERSSGDPQRLAVVSPGVRVLVIAIDGFDPAVFEEMRATRLPAFAAQFSRGYLRVPADDGRDPARVWTTVATGQPPSVHGVESLETRRLAGVQGTVASVDDVGVRRAIRGATDLLRLTQPAIASGVERRVKTFWEVAADAGLRSVAVNWWATWPAAEAGPHPATILSDRALLRLERGGELDAEIAPRAVYDELRRDWPAIKALAGSEVEKRLQRITDATIDASLRRSAELDAIHLVLAKRFTGQTPDVVTVYLPGLDIAQHTLLGNGYSAGPSALAARLEALRTYYVFLDGLLGETLTATSDRAVVLLTQPGRRSSPSYGTFTLAAPIAASRTDGTLAAVDITPTVLQALGVPISRELAGRPALQVFAPAFVSRFPVREVATYGAPNASGAVRHGQPLDEEMVERLRSLGYVR
jgi:hypothetical protein